MMNVLIVDDEWFVRQGLISLMPWSDFGMRVAGEACGGEEALQMLQQQRFELVFVDLTMPGMSGFELMREIRLQDPYMKMVVLTCHQDFEYVQEALRLGVIDYLVKTALAKDKMREALERIANRVQLERGFTRPESAGNGPSGKGYLFIRLSDSSLPGEFPLSFSKSVAEQDKIEIRPGLWFVPRLVSEHEESEMISRFLYQAQEVPWTLVKVGDLENRSIREIASKLESYADHELFYAYTPESAVYELSLHSVDNSPALWDEVGLYSFIGEWSTLSWVFDEDHYRHILVRLHGLRLSRPLLQRFLERVWEETETWFGPLDNVLKPADCGISPTWHQWKLRLSAMKGGLSRLLAERNPLEVAGNVTKALRYIEEHLDDKLAQDDVAGIAFMSRGYFSLCFKNVMNATFSDYVRLKRLQKAKMYLRETDQTIQKISLQTGFQDEKYFSKSFKKATGMLPSDYRKQHAQANI
ncbi:response regulator [Paenibacillus sp. GCM10027626]|uniref:response regulator transcription factor n=1 Tax=Paenibacillus sp. GCM10027626 TaxID=3273411 RepID=UPI003629E122